MRERGAVFLFESSWKKSYSTRGVRAMLARYAERAGLPHNMPPHRPRHFLFTALIQPYSGHASRTSLEIYSRLGSSELGTAYGQPGPTVRRGHRPGRSDGGPAVSAGAGAPELVYGWAPA
jgi:site-specific recombinase XerD